MKKFFFLFAMLTSVAASATVTVTPLSTDYATKKVTFSVSWTNTPAAPYNNRVWIWIDFCPVNGVTPATSFSTATISNPQKTGGNGTITNITTRGFFIEYGATNAGTTVTATLSNAPAGKFNWCVYGSDYPPNVTLDKGTYTFKGTTNFIVNTPAQTITTKTIAKANLTVNSSSTFTDATGCPGIGSLYCPYTGSDLYMDATHLCQQRTTGAKNWEAYIKDSRDNQIYHITQFSDNTWWFADDLAIATYSEGICNGKQNYYGANNHPLCPSGWLLPTTNDLRTRWPNPNYDDYGGLLTEGQFYALPGNGYHTNGCNHAHPPRWDYVTSGCNNCSRWYGAQTQWDFMNGDSCSAKTNYACRARCVR
ncbi:MAG: hypothetical protein LBF81_02715 [Prevotellaceae bacterium]|jgi:hypothetical protein|nr:hypothetical protein [Prevotellaceae bacterium]